ncbi:hypothetical protein C0J08_20910 [Marinomonas sp. CT5]|uniref:nucleotidyltransferase family protein n=1 Tax=Marinomonas sp. CT5 TaxID=2066133 RepID=UPI001BAFB6FB|nr:sugar phosphate nucleotidyltransferase [Marinomonas sp. CT5]QUX97720.1 hypothetical protein C0J08_20910 [Marinomonas sp. CT5]
MTFENTDVVILCGGLGTRFRAVIDNQPKGLASVAGKPILDRIIDDLIEQGAKRIILCVGYLSEQIVEYYGNRTDVEFRFSTEDTPLGTGGAVKNATPLIQADKVLVLNGDSLCSISFQDLLLYHEKNESFLTVVTSYSKDIGDYGNLSLDEKGKILSFREKVKSDGSPLISAGIYLMNKDALNEIQGEYPISIEVDFFPEVVTKHNCMGYMTESEVMDIGTPERYKKINEILN